MPSSLDSESLAALDSCVDAILAGVDWHPYLPDSEEQREEVVRLVAVAERLLALAKSTPAAPTGWKQAAWRRLRTKMSIIRAIAFYRLPYLPPLWIKPEAC